MRPPSKLSPHAAAVLPQGSWFSRSGSLIVAANVLGTKGTNAPRSADDRHRAERCPAGADPAGAEAAPKTSRRAEAASRQGGVADRCYDSPREQTPGPEGRCTPPSRPAPTPLRRPPARMLVGVSGGSPAPTRTGPPVATTSRTEWIHQHGIRHQPLRGSGGSAGGGSSSGSSGGGSGTRVGSGTGGSRAGAGDAGQRRRAAGPAVAGPAVAGPMAAGRSSAAASAARASARWI